MIFVRGHIDQQALAAEIAGAIQHLGPNVVRVRYSFAEDSIGDPAIYFRIVLTDESSRATNLADVTGAIAGKMFQRLDPYERWGLSPYFRYRSVSEADKRNDPDWA